MREIDWKMSLDKYLTNPPDDPESHLHCDGDKCRWTFIPEDKVYRIEELNLCRECALKWLEERAEIVTEEECYGDSECW